VLHHVLLQVLPARTIISRAFILVDFLIMSNRQRLRFGIRHGVSRSPEFKTWQAQVRHWN
jgi:hypothetical protein